MIKIVKNKPYEYENRCIAYGPNIDRYFRTTHSMHYCQNTVIQRGRQNSIVISVSINERIIRLVTICTKPWYQK